MRKPARAPLGATLSKKASSVRLALVAAPVTAVLGLVAFLLLPDASSRLASRGQVVGRAGADLAVAASSKERTATAAKFAGRSARAIDRSSPGPEGASRALAAGSEARRDGDGATGTAVAGATRSAAAKPDPGVTRAPASEAERLARIRAGLLSPDPKTRLAAIRAARDLHSPELQADVVNLLETEQSLPVKRVATQFLAQGDSLACAPLLRTLEQDPDPVVRVNAGFGLARAGDENEQARLLCMCETARKSGPAVLAVVANALEDPALRSPAVIARFQTVADNPNVPAATREHALAVVQAKQSAPAAR
jgi:hypothetical protein